ncbi:TPA: hypothetical protein HA265_03705 [Candidatus Woesearchaeota archaeon]|nr:hypothetical protein [Candidatus Woesearchaeota archaeon]
MYETAHVNIGLDKTDPKKLAAIARVESALVRGARRYFEERGFTEVTVPHITRATGACENIDTLFALDFFGNQSYLVQTGQLYLESLIPDLGRVFCDGPSFRAEPAVDERHLTEFRLVEMEFPITKPGTVDELLDEIEGLVQAMAREGLAQEDALRYLGAGRGAGVLTEPYERITYRDAVKMLGGCGVRFGDDLKSSHEAEIVRRTGRPTFITHYPIAIKFFNMKQNPQDPEVVNSADLILPYSGEAVGAAEREWEYDSLVRRLETSPMLRQLERRGGSIEDFKWYLEEVRQRGIPHAGCGVGLNRVTQSLIGSGDIRMSTAYPQNREGLM